MTIKNRWQIFPNQTTIANKIAETLHCLPIIGQLLLNRNVKNITEASQFLNPNWTHFPKLPNQDLFIKEFTNLVNNKAAICVYGDYDADGVTSLTIMVDILKKLGCNVAYIAPHRLNDGYGLNNHRMEEVARKKFDALITLDCGISNKKEIDLLQSLNPSIKVLIIDHHKCPETLPNADAIINPQLAETTHPARNLCTAGIIDYIFRSSPIDDINIDEYEDLVAIGLIADVMPLTQLNRWYVKKGLESIQKNPRKAILELCINAKTHTESITCKDIAFGIAPRLNAAGRLGDPTIAVKTLLEESPEKLAEFTKELEKINTKRKTIGESIQKDINKQLDDQDSSMNTGIICSGQFWHMGIIGINAARIVDKYHKPAIVIGFNDDIARGSARSIPNVNIYNIIKECSDNLEHFGGHPQAAGFSLKPTNITAFKKQFIEKCNESINQDNLTKRIIIDAAINLKDITLNFIDELAKLEPYGEANPQPTFTASVNLIEAKKVGQKQNHLKCRFEQDGSITDGIGFNLAHKLEFINQQQVNILFTVSKNNFNGKITPQIELIDIQ